MSIILNASFPNEAKVSVGAVWTLQGFFVQQQSILTNKQTSRSLGYKRTSCVTVIEKLNRVLFDNPKGNVQNNANTCTVIKFIDRVK